MWKAVRASGVLMACGYWLWKLLSLYSAAVCRICHSGEQSSLITGSPLVSFCKCSGTMGLYHRECLEHWLRIRPPTGEKESHSCEICQQPYCVSTVPPPLRDVRIVALLRIFNFARAVSSCGRLSDGASSPLRRRYLLLSADTIGNRLDYLHDHSEPLILFDISLVICTVSGHINLLRYTR